MVSRESFCHTYSTTGENSQNRTVVSPLDMVYACVKLESSPEFVPSGDFDVDFAVDRGKIVPAERCNVRSFLTNFRGEVRISYHVDENGSEILSMDSGMLKSLGRTASELMLRSAYQRHP